MRNMWFARVLVICAVLCCEGKLFESRCKLVRELLKVGMPNDMFLGHWVCLIEKVSKRNTAAHVITSNKEYYGLYQIPNEWCRKKKAGGKCNVACESLLDDDIRDDTRCAVQIMTEKGFKYWSLWTIRCKNDNFVTFITEEIYKCPDLMHYRRRGLLSTLNEDPSSKSTEGNLSINSTETQD